LSLVRSSHPRSRKRSVPLSSQDTLRCASPTGTARGLSFCLIRRVCRWFGRLARGPQEVCPFVVPLAVPVRSLAKWSGPLSSGNTLRVPNGDRENSLGLSTAMPQVTTPPHQGALKGRESRPMPVDTPPDGEIISQFPTPRASPTGHKRSVLLSSHSRGAREHKRSVLLSGSGVFVVGSTVSPEVPQEVCPIVVWKYPARPQRGTKGLSFCLIRRFCRWFGSLSRGPQEVCLFVVARYPARPQRGTKGLSFCLIRRVCLRLGRRTRGSTKGLSLCRLSRCRRSGRLSGPTHSMV